MIPDIIELNFPKKDGKQYATLTQATASIADMGEKAITTQVKIDGEIVPDFSFDWEVEFQGEKYIMPLRIPQGAKGNESLKSQIDLTFQHWAIYQLKRWPFVTIQQIAAGTYLPDEEVATVSLNLGDFCTLFGQVLEYYYGGAITIGLNPAWEYDKTATVITISHTKIWNVLIDAFHGKYGVRWEIKAATDNSNTVKGGEKYVIRVGYPTTEVDHIFEYGFEGGLLKVERQVQSEEIRNILKGRGGDTNIPFRYFKDTDTNNPDFRPDPDWVEELANIYFTNLMPATFRSYVQGWKAAHISKYPGYTVVGESNAYAPWAYRKGYTDTKFAPVEFVADEITINPTSGDKQVEILPGYSPYVKKNSSLDKYGPLPDTLDNNDDIYPTLQGTGLDIAVDVEQIESDDVAESTESDAQVRTLDKEVSAVRKVEKTKRVEFVIRSRNFTVGAGKTANLDEGTKNIVLTKDEKKIVWRSNGKWGPHVETFQVEVENWNVTIEDASLVVVNVITGQEISASGITGGTYYFRLSLTVYNTANETYNVSVECPEPKLTAATLDDNKWLNTFDIWVPNVWGSSKLSTETDAQYSERVWKPVLGDRKGNTAKVMFTSGNLAHEDYEFTIVDFPVRDTGKTWTDADGTTHTSHWRIKLAKSDAELEATGLYVPSTKKQGKAGDTFVFIGTEMTHVPYVVDAEMRLDDWKKDQLGEKKEIKPTAVVTTDRVRLNNEGKPNALINQLRVGNSLRLFDKRFFHEEGKAYETLYLQSITYTYREPSSDDAALNPDVEIVLGNEYTTSANPVSMMQSEISALQRQVGSISNVEQIVRAVGDKLYLRKDGISDRSLSPTQFFSLLTSGDFRAGIVGGAGWGFFKDENGNWVLEADRVNVRQEVQVNNLVTNQITARGGMIIESAAQIEIIRVIETSDSYICYFDQKNGTISNLFHIDDVAYSQIFDSGNTSIKFYKRRVMSIDDNSITLTKGYDPITLPNGTIDTGVNGNGIPQEGDVVVHFGNYTDPTRRFVKIRDVIHGGYDSYIEMLDSVNANGVEYYFVGKRNSNSTSWFVGYRDQIPNSGKGDGSFIEFKNKKFNLNNVTLSTNTVIGDKPIDDFIKDSTSFIVEYSTDGTDGSWHDTYQNGDRYWRQSDDNGQTWTDAIPLVGENGSAAVIFSIESSVSNISKTYNGELSTTNFSVTKYKTTGADPRIATTDKILRYQRMQHSNGMEVVGRVITLSSHGGDATSIIDVTEQDVAFIFTLYDIDGITELDNIRVPVLTDATGINDEINSFDYLKEALKQGSEISGGLIQTSVTALGYFDENHEFHVFAGSNGLYNEDMPGGGLAFWAGGKPIDINSPDADESTAKYGVRMDGSFFSTNADIRGKVTATEGKIGDFNIKDSDLSSSYVSDSSGSVYSAVMNRYGLVVKYRNAIKNMITGIESYARVQYNILSPQLKISDNDLGDVPGNNNNASASIISWDTVKYAQADNNIALLLKAGGHADPIKNFALYIPNGITAGLRPMGRTISTNTILTVFDYYIFISKSSTSTITITLPNNAEIGQTYMIFNTNAVAVNVNIPNATQLIHSNKNYNTIVLIKCGTGNTINDWIARLWSHSA